MAALSLAIIGKNNEPLYMKEFRDESLQDDVVPEEELFGLPPAADGNGSSTGGWDCSIRHQFILHAALDRYEQLAGPAPGYGWRTAGVSGTDAMFMGLLCPVEDMRVYGEQCRWELNADSHACMLVYRCDALIIPLSQLSRSLLLQAI